MEYNWIKAIARISDDYTIIHFHDNFDQKIEPNTLPEKLTSLIFGYEFNQKIEPNTLPEKLTSLIFGSCFNQKIGPNTLPENLITVTFGHDFNQEIDPNTLPEKLITLTFGGHFNQKIYSKMLPSNLKNINFNWIYLGIFDPIGHHIEMVNNIPNYYYVNIFLWKNIFGDDGPKWPIHVVKYIENEWSSDIYDIQDTYTHPIYGPITVLINKETYQPYSFAKSAHK